MKHWIDAARVRTLPLSVSGILVGSFYAMSQSLFNWNIVLFALLTTIGLQVLSNFANDYGDGVKGTDNDSRIGPKRAIQSGVITLKEMRNAIVITAIITLFFALCLIYFAFKERYLWYSLFFSILGIIAIASAVRYTVGKNPYGYRGFGDLFVFIFFGFVSTMGTYFLFAKEIDWLLVLPSTAIGFLSVGVLNLNNMRDLKSDKNSGKITLAVRFGRENARRYHYFLIISAMIILLMFAFVNDMQNDGMINFDQYLFVVMYLPLSRHLYRVYENTRPKDFDPELKKLALTTFFIALLMSLQLIYFISDLLVNYL